MSDPSDPEVPARNKRADTPDDWVTSNFIILPPDEYDGLLIAGLITVHGVEATEAEEYVKRERWPLNADDTLAECHGRGLVLERPDLRAFLDWKFRSLGETEDIPGPDQVDWTQSLVDKCIEWCVNRSRGRLFREMPEGPITRDRMFELMRSDSPVSRLLGGKYLALALGAGLKQRGETQEDFDHILAPLLSELLARAMFLNDQSAVDQLDSYVERREPALLLARRSKP
jgi:hypothetical protein